MTPRLIKFTVKLQNKYRRNEKISEKYGSACSEYIFKILNLFRVPAKVTVPADSN